jgi:uncharacterized membrane protein
MSPLGRIALMILADLVGLMVVGAIILLAAAGWQAVWQ